MLTRLLKFVQLKKSFSKIFLCLYISAKHIMNFQNNNDHKSADIPKHSWCSITIVLKSFIIFTFQSVQKTCLLTYYETWYFHEIFFYRRGLRRLKRTKYIFHINWVASNRIRRCGWSSWNTPPFTTPKRSLSRARWCESHTRASK